MEHAALHGKSGVFLLAEIALEGHFHSARRLEPNQGLASSRRGDPFLFSLFFSFLFLFSFFFSLFSIFFNSGEGSEGGGGGG